MQQDQSVSQMAQEALERQAKALAHRSGHSLEDARQAVSETEAADSLGIWHKVSIAMRRLRSGRRVCFGIGPSRD